MKLKIILIFIIFMAFLSTCLWSYLLLGYIKFAKYQPIKVGLLSVATLGCFGAFLYGISEYRKAFKG